jgi:hypothetical protein
MFAGFGNDEIADGHTCNHRCDRLGQVGETEPGSIRSRHDKDGRGQGPEQVTASTAFGRVVLHGKRDERIRKITKICVAIDSRNQPVWKSVSSA